MKASDSTNSLTALNPSTPTEKICFICLDEQTLDGEPLVDSIMLRNCGCKFSVHPQCWNQWMKGKSDYDCPICRKDSMLRIKIPPNPVMVIAVEEEETQPFITKGRIIMFLIGLGAILFLGYSIAYWG